MARLSSTLAPALARLSSLNAGAGAGQAQLNADAGATSGSKSKTGLDRMVSEEELIEELQKQCFSSCLIEMDLAGDCQKFKVLFNEKGPSCCEIYRP